MARDIEAGGGGGGVEAGMRWAFIRKVFAVVFVQLLICAAVSAAMFFTPAVKTTFMGTTYAPIVLIALVILTFILLMAMRILDQKYPCNYVCLGLFTIAIAFMVGMVCTYKKGMPIMLAAGVTVMVFVALTLYTLWATMRGHDFFFLGPFFICAFMVLILFSLIKNVLHMGSIVQLICGAFGALIFSGFIVNEYVDASCCLFLDIINLFFAFLNILIQVCGD